MARQRVAPPPAATFLLLLLSSRGGGTTATASSFRFGVVVGGGCASSPFARTADALRPTRTRPPRPRRGPRPTDRGRPVAFAAGGGGGGGFGGGAKSAAVPKKKATKKKKKKSSLLGEFARASPPEPSATSAGGEERPPKLDRFGLPPPTEEDIFPPLPPGTELVRGASTNKAEVVSALRNHWNDVNWDAFDDDCRGLGCLDGMRMRMVHVSPPVLTIENFFTEDECDEAYAVAVPPASASPEDEDEDEGDEKKRSAVQVNSATFSPLATSKRTSTTWFCHYAAMPTLLSKARYVLGVDPRRMEEPQIVRYRPGEEFSWHYDEVPSSQLRNGGQRVGTLLVYLNTLEEGRGGSTIFRDLEEQEEEDSTSSGGEGKGRRRRRGRTLAVRPVKGTALLFFPSYGDGAPDDRTLHRGEATTAADAEKRIAQVWIHERPYDPAVPEGNDQGGAATEAMERKDAELGYRLR